MSKLAPRVSSSVIRSIDSKKLWDSLQRNTKDDLVDVDDSSISLASPGEANHRKDEETRDSNTKPADPSSKVEALNRLRYAPYDSTLPKRIEPQARVSILNKGNHEESIEGSLPAKPFASVNIQKAEGNDEESIEVSPAEPPPKRRRVELRRSTRQQEKAQNIDPDELILVFPYGVPGAVNVTRSDLARLDPEALLNDTLIEFGLKFWLKKLEVENPALASQVYLFNSFFYKKLNKRNKKYIIIPINENLHWYCAIIYEPEHILQQLPDAGTPHTNAVTRRQARDMQVSEEVVSEKVEVTPDPADVDEAMQDGTASENEVERMALSNANPLNEDPVTSVAPDFGVSSMEASDQVVSNLTPGSPMEVDIEIPPVVEVETSSSKSTMSGTTTNEGTNTPVGPPNGVRATAVQLDEITPARFYGKSFTNGARKRASIAAENVQDDTPKTKIFILDSIGNRHPQAMKQLNKWLQLEAEDKKKISKPASAFTKLVSLPVQPNFSDCGIYVIHFVQTLMGDPEHYCKVIMMKDRPPSSERRVDWKDDTVSTIRDQLRGHILQLSDEWSELRAAREEEKKQQQIVEESDEDSDVAIVDHVRASAKKGRSTKSARTKG
ncbi:hypothetical protein AGABI2DRAFT_179332 [Agaricus bisporus var. bisporus H97]|uniref:hypothetical protein n=1 Tax=Agaricus bisporus var. bisporus (strain H97 / ATCC MYA-4626 / FGSC 10389) TaxID=936046 RepID=UPI00029F611B|nr:hypothetical protein AGABI2DRAFT_179332 [Agaricus bisporus var. bisporus H97]EKV45852.1 hypothetical protein AGABI2DRAFT_179332 [Agaricus bisporus var. bisporus H97]